MICPFYLIVSTLVCLLFYNSLALFFESSADFDAQIKLRSQYWFYMETQTALAVPDEDNCITVCSSVQWPEFLHRSIARCLGIPENNVRVVTRQLGGSFGGKILRAMTVSILKVEFKSSLPFYFIHS